ncbi:PREDICTED: F-box/kelch-repeat protein OR23-like isoform X1 [Camelina sativa]|uniref:F-box/kelch-repeat protein OR23-like isoform X1 n=1 Tax=Camelina sativa TaxID=90675 RepID=A0ABM0T8J0_CAMSA|nr:PREDICTED: F-box/kelch-repeat protein OR23-like isoform X1 [Camelina sativa]
MPLPIFSSRLQCSSSSSSSRSSFPRPKRRIDPSLTLIPGLSNDVARLILSFVPYPHTSRLKSTCKSWYAFLSSKTLISLRHGRDNRDGDNLSHLLCIFPQDPSISPPFLFDPVTLSWRPLPLLPCNPHVYSLCNFVAVAIGPCVYVLGGSAFDTRSFPLDVLLPTSTVFRYSFVKSVWERLSPMLSPRGSFACAAVTGLSNRIIVAGGGSRHTLFGAAGSRMSSVEMYDVEKDEWREMDELPRFRAGCVGFLVGNNEGDEKEKGREFWVMGGYGRSRTVSGILPVDEYYRDAAVMGLSGEKWRLVGDMWGEEERPKLGKIVTVDCGKPVFFMLDKDRILRYEIGSNRWRRESSVPKKALYDEPVGFVALNGELHVMILLDGYNLMDTRGGTRQHRNAGSLMIHIYDPKKKTWRSVVTKPPFNHQLDLRTTVMCTIRL